MDTIKELNKLFDLLEEAEEYHDCLLIGSVLRKIHESKQKVRKLIEEIESHEKD